MEAELNQCQESKENEANKRPRAFRRARDFYIKLNRYRVRMEHRHLTSIEVEKKCLADWKALGSQGRKKYEDMSTEDKTRHTKEMGKENEANKRPRGFRRAREFYTILNRYRVRMEHQDFTSIEVDQKS